MMFFSEAEDIAFYRLLKRNSEGVFQPLRIPESIHARFITRYLRIPNRTTATLRLEIL